MQKTNLKKNRQTEKDGFFCKEKKYSIVAGTLHLIIISFLVGKYFWRCAECAHTNIKRQMLAIIQCLANDNGIECIKCGKKESGK